MTIPVESFVLCVMGAAFGAFAVGLLLGAVERTAEVRRELGEQLTALLVSGEELAGALRLAVREVEQLPRLQVRDAALDASDSSLARWRRVAADARAAVLRGRP